MCVIFNEFQSDFMRAGTALSDTWRATYQTLAKTVEGVNDMGLHMHFRVNHRFLRTFSDSRAWAGRAVLALGQCSQKTKTNKPKESKNLSERTSLLERSAFWWRCFSQPGLGLVIAQTFQGGESRQGHCNPHQWPEGPFTLDALFQGRLSPHTAVGSLTCCADTCSVCHLSCRPDWF